MQTEATFVGQIKATVSRGWISHVYTDCNSNKPLMCTWITSSIGFLFANEMMVSATVIPNVVTTLHYIKNNPNETLEHLIHCEWSNI
jgi:hypothetical protein